MNRRELLTGFLGLPVALAACRRTETPLPAGEIVGASDVFGHRVRDGLRVEIPQDAWSNIPLVIVGPGLQEDETALLDDEARAAIQVVNGIDDETLWRLYCDAAAILMSSTIADTTTVGLSRIARSVSVIEPSRFGDWGR